MLDPSTVYLDHSVDLAQDVVLEPNVTLRGATSSASGRGSRPARRCSTRRSGADCVIWASVVERSTVEDEVTIGPFSHLRPGATSAAGSEIGNFAEIKNSRLGDARPPAPHELPRRR